MVNGEFVVKCVFLGNGFNFISWLEIKCKLVSEFLYIIIFYVEDLVKGSDLVFWDSKWFDY